MKAITFDQAKRIDAFTIEEGIPERILMGQAAQSAFTTLQHLGLVNSQSFYVFLCGSGNNGGDGIALAYLLLSSNSLSNEQIWVYLNEPIKSETALFYYQHLKKQLPNIFPLDSFLSLTFSEIVSKLLSFPQVKRVLFIEALLGTGQKDQPKQPYDRILSHLNQMINSLQKQIETKCVALDVPAGLSEEYKDFHEDAFLSLFGYPVPDVVLNFGPKKLCLAIHPLLVSRSQVFSLPIGFSPQAQKNVLLESPRFTEWEIQSDFSFFLKKPEDHKYTAGYGWLIAGSQNMEGAGILSAKAFFSSGGGILHWLHLTNQRELLLHKEPAIIYTHFFEWEKHLPTSKRPSAIAIGPGVSKNDLLENKKNFINFLKYFSQNPPFPFIILDAFATQLVLENDYPEELRPFTIITPHLGEWRAMGGAFPYLVGNWKRIIEFHKKLKVSILIKGGISFFLVSVHWTNEESLVFIWNHPNPNLAVAGSGDLLVGILLSYFSKTPKENPLTSLLGVQKVLSLHTVSSKFHATPTEQLKQLKRTLFEFWKNNSK